jgi:hypothetical protein
MKQKSIYLALLLAITAGLPARAQVTEPTPSPDPHTYTDPGMSYTAPANALLINRQELPLSALSQDLQPVAAWALNPGREDARLITLSMEAYNGPPSQWEGQFESQTHGAQDGTLIRGKTPITLLNGMPAYFVEVAYGSGFDAKKEFAVVWADGVRGIVLAETTRLGDAKREEAESVLKQVTATRYPLYQP